MWSPVARRAPAAAEGWERATIVVALWDRFDLPFAAAAGRLARRRGLWTPEAESDRDWSASGGCEHDLAVQLAGSRCWAIVSVLRAPVARFANAAVAVAARARRAPTAMFVDPAGRHLSIGDLRPLLGPSLALPHHDFSWREHALAATDRGLHPYYDIDELSASLALVGPSGLVRPLARRS